MLGVCICVCIYVCIDIIILLLLLLEALSLVSSGLLLVNHASSGMNHTSWINMVVSSLYCQI